MYVRVKGEPGKREVENIVELGLLTLLTRGLKDVGWWLLLVANKQKIVGERSRARPDLWADWRRGNWERMTMTKMRRCTDRKHKREVIGAAAAAWGLCLRVARCGKGRRACVLMLCLSKV